MNRIDRPYLRFVLLVALAASIAIPALAEEGEKKINISGDIRTRWEFLNNYVDLDDDAQPDDDFDVAPYRVRIAAQGNFSDNVIGHIGVQKYGFFGDDTTPLRTGQTPTGQFTEFGDQDAFLYQGFLQLNEIGGSSWNLRAGRQEHTFANELLIGDADFYNGLVFDGVRGMGDFERWDLDLFVYVVDERNFPGAPAPEVPDDEVEFYGATADFTILEDQALRPYLLGVRSRTIGSPAFDAKIYTLGAQYGRAVDSIDDVDANAFDWNLEGALQGGEFQPDTTDGDFGGTIFEGWLGYSWTHDRSRSRVHIGGLWASGDDDADNDIDAFVPLFGDTHALNRLGNLDLFDASGAAAITGTTDPIGSPLMTNVRDLNAGYAFHGEKHRFGATAHVLSFAEEAQAGTVDDSIGTEIDLVYGYMITSQLDFEVGASQLSPGDALDELAFPAATADDIQRAWMQLHLRWN